MILFFVLMKLGPILYNVCYIEEKGIGLLLVKIHNLGQGDLMSTKS